ncbi:MAG: nucleotidyltransferase family protein [Bacillota bacterium]
MKVDAIVLAGSPNNGKLAQCSSAANEALIEIGGRIIVDYVVSALREARLVDRIAIVGPVDDLAPIYAGMPGILLSPGGHTAMQSVVKGLKALDTLGQVLVVTSDVPLLKAQTVDEFIEQCGDQSRDFYYPVVSKELNEARYPGVKRTYVKLKEGTYTGGNIFLLRGEAVFRCLPKAERLVSLRKNPLAMAWTVGLPLIIKLLLQILPIKEAEQRVSRMLDINGKVIISSCPELGIDVDKPEDLELVKGVLMNKPAASVQNLS